MNRTFKIFLGLAAGILVFCLILTVAGLLLFRSAGKALTETFQTDVATTSQIATKIADFELPAGYGNEVTAQLAGYSLIGYTGADAHSHIYLVQADSSTGLTMEEIQRHIRQTSDAEEDQMVDVKIVDTVQATIRGQEVNVVISEGPNHDGDVFRQVSGLFEGRGGPAVVIVSGLAATWNQALVDEFIASIR
jgi:hypothetical protein